MSDLQNCGAAVFSLAAGEAERFAAPSANESPRPADLLQRMNSSAADLPALFDRAFFKLQEDTARLAQGVRPEDPREFIDPLLGLLEQVPRHDQEAVVRAVVCSAAEALTKRLGDPRDTVAALLGATIRSLQSAYLEPGYLADARQRAKAESTPEHTVHVWEVLDRDVENAKEALKDWR